MVEEIEAHILKRYELLNKQGIILNILFTFWFLLHKIIAISLFNLYKLCSFLLKYNKIFLKKIEIIKFITYFYIFWVDNYHNSI